MKVLNDLNFIEGTRNGNVVVDFYADWCGPCKMVAPVLEELDATMDNINIVKVDVDNNATQTASKFGVRSIPTMVFLKDGVEIERLVGALPKQALVDKINKTFNESSS